MTRDIFQEEYKKLNPAQRQAVEAIDGPVMVVAGPGTGKTQILALRIGNIILKTDTKADEILCLTFTNSGVRAMYDRLQGYIGALANNVRINTFHSFGLLLIEKYYELLGFQKLPKLLDDQEAVFLVDEILHDNDWLYLRPRANPGMYFNDLKQLISILKRERLTPAEFKSYLESDIENLKNNESSISSRGESRGKLKKEVEKKIESLERTKEVVDFYRIYEEKKRASALLDYDDILEYTVQLVEDYEDIRADIYENYQYILIDEHQDSSNVQNNFLKAVWKNTEMPNIFVVGDDRQLIYAFSGAKLSYFEEFSHIFGKAKLIVLTENYRSTKSILSLADDLLKSTITKDKLHSNTKVNSKISLNEFAYPRDEIIGAGLYFKEKIKAGVAPEECAILVPKNYQVRSAINILSGLGLSVSTGGNLSLFDLAEAQSFLNILNIINDPFDAVSIAESLLDKYSGIDALTAHKFLKKSKPKLNLEDLISNNKNSALFQDEDSISKWGIKLAGWIKTPSNEKISNIVSIVGNELLIDSSKGHEDLIRNVEVVRSFIHLATLYEQKQKNKKLPDFLKYLKRLESYGSHIGLATFGCDAGIQVMTLHKSKGLEYKAVWIAHMNEEIIMSEKKNSFSLPEKVKIHLQEKDIESTKRELYVAITRAKEFCNISYASEDYHKGTLELAHIIRELPELHFLKKNKTETEKEILANGPQVYASISKGVETDTISTLKKFVRENYNQTSISVTLLNNFFECPWKWYFRNFLKLPEVKGFSLVFGSLVHSVIEFILKNKSLPQTEIIKDKIKGELEKEGVGSLTELKKLQAEAFNAVMYFVKNFYTEISGSYTSERSLQFRDSKFPELTMYGKLDLTEKLPNGDIMVTDFKTGSIKTAGVIEKLDEEGRLSSYMRQLAMYSYLIFGAEKGSEVALSRLLFVESKENDKNALYSTHIDAKQIKLLEKDISDYNELLKSGEWVNRPCQNNSYSKPGAVCQYCKKAEIYKK